MLISAQTNLNSLVTTILQGMDQLALSLNVMPGGTTLLDFGSFGTTSTEYIYIIRRFMRGKHGRYLRHAVTLTDMPGII